MTHAERIPLAPASAIAAELVELLRPGCARIEVAGSIRRRKPTVKDVEIVAASLWEPTRNLFGEAIGLIDLLSRLCDKLAHEGVWTKRTDPDGTGGAWGPRHKRAVYRDVPIDLFVVAPPAQWGVIYALRTGPAEYSRRLVTRRFGGGFLPYPMFVRDGALWTVVSRNGTAHDSAIDTPEEADMFAALGLPWRAPWDR